MSSCIPLRIVPDDDSLSDWLFGGRLDDPRFLNGDCFTFAVLKMEDGSLLYLAITTDFDWICNHCDKPLYSDWKHVVVERIEEFSCAEVSLEFHPRVGLERLMEAEDPGADPDNYWDIHRLGGSSRWLERHPSPHLHFIAQIEFPDSNDLSLNLDWPTGEWPVEIHYDKVAHAHCVLWRVDS